MLQRIWQLWTCFCLCIAVLGLRLASQMIWLPAQPAPASQPGGFRTAADLGHMQTVQTNDGRGRILYRDGSIWDTRAGAPDPVVGLIGLPDRWPDPSRGALKQGRSGLELRFDRFLKSGSPSFIGHLTGDASGRWYTHHSPSGVNVRTTIDPQWQSAARDVLAAAGIAHGAVVVLDTKTNDILAMASRGNESTLGNLAVAPAAPGSVFKLVTAAAALNVYRVTDGSHFICDGAVHIPGVHMRCWTRHGDLTLVPAIAQSCDAAFANIGVQLGRQGLLRMAERLHLNATGLQRVAGSPVLPEAQNGRVFVRSGTDTGLLANTAIGQQDVRLSPLQGALLASTIANRGRYADARLLLETERKGKAGRLFLPEPQVRAFSEYTADTIGQGMWLAAHAPLGTAAWLGHLKPLVAVKTGTAELPDGKVNGWLVGYWPADGPTNAFCVFVGDQPSVRAHEQIRLAATGLLQAYRQFHSDSVIN